jgi:hypothetical protein
MPNTVQETQDHENAETLMARPDAIPYMGQDRYEALQDDPEVAPEDAEELPEVDPDDAEEVTFKKRYGDLRRYHAKEMDQLKKDLAKAQEEKPAAWVPPKTDEEMEAWITEYPDAYDVFATIARKQAIEEGKRMDDLVEEVREAKRETSKEKAINIINKAHEDWDDIRHDDAFHEWADTQPRLIQDALYNNDDDGAAVVRAIDLYKFDTGISKGNKSRDKGDMKKAAAALVSTGKKVEAKDGKGDKKIWTFGEIQSMTLHEYEKHEKEIELAQREGRIVES